MARAIGGAADRLTATRSCGCPRPGATRQASPTSPIVLPSDDGAGRAGTRSRSRGRTAGATASSTEGRDIVHIALHRRARASCAGIALRPVRRRPRPHPRSRALRGRLVRHGRRARVTLKFDRDADRRRGESREGRWVENHRDHSPAVLPRGWDTAGGRRRNPEDSQLLESRSRGDVEVARMFGHRAGRAAAGRARAAARSPTRTSSGMLDHVRQGDGAAGLPLADRGGAVGPPAAHPGRSVQLRRAVSSVAEADAIPVESWRSTAGISTCPKCAARHGRPRRAAADPARPAADTRRARRYPSMTDLLTTVAPMPRFRFARKASGSIDARLLRGARSPQTAKGPSGSPAAPSAASIRATVSARSDRRPRRGAGRTARRARRVDRGARGWRLCDRSACPARATATSCSSSCATACTDACRSCSRPCSRAAVGRCDRTPAVDLGRVGIVERGAYPAAEVLAVRSGRMRMAPNSRTRRPSPSPIPSPRRRPSRRPGAVLARAGRDRSTPCEPTWSGGWSRSRRAAPAGGAPSPRAVRDCADYLDAAWTIPTSAPCSARVLADQITSDNPGVIPPSWAAEVAGHHRPPAPRGQGDRRARRRSATRAWSSTWPYLDPALDLDT